MKTHMYKKTEMGFEKYEDKKIEEIFAFFGWENKTRKFKVGDCIKIIEVIENGYSHKHSFTGREVNCIVIATKREMRLGDISNSMKVIKVSNMEDK